MRFKSHIITSVSLTVTIWVFTRSFWAGVLCFIFGTLIDIDHAIEHGLAFGWKNVSYKNVAYASRRTAKIGKKGGYEKSKLIFHAIELVILTWIAFIYMENIYFFAVALGYSVHMAMDQMANGARPLSYFITWRAIKGFDTDKIFIKKPFI